MSIFPTDILDKGHFELLEYKLSALFFLEGNMEIHFQEIIGIRNGFIIKLKEVVAFAGWPSKNSIKTFRVDSDGSSYGWDIAIRLHNEEYKQYNVLYLFRNLEHSSIAFKALAREISLEELK